MKIILDGIPLAQGRMKFSSRGGFGRLYDPNEKAKNALKEQIKVLWDWDFVEHPRVSFIFHMPIPKSIPKKLLSLYQSGLLKHEKKPDVDNFIKLYLDCMTEIVFRGDQQVQLGFAIKLYHPHPKTIIIINETSPALSRLEIDPLTWMALFGKECGRCSSSEMASLPGFYTPDDLAPSQSDDAKDHSSLAFASQKELLAPHEEVLKSPAYTLSRFQSL